MDKGGLYNPNQTPEEFFAGEKKVVGHLNIFYCQSTFMFQKRRGQRWIHPKIKGHLLDIVNPPKLIEYMFYEKDRLNLAEM